MLRRVKTVLKRYIRAHRRVYRLVSPVFGRDFNRAMRRARRQNGIDGDLVVFASYRMSGYNDNPRYISEALHDTRPWTDIVWLFRDAAAARARYDIPDYVRCLDYPSDAAWDALGRARVLVDNWRKRDFLRFGRKQVYVFSPHHDRCFKRGVLDMEDRLYSHVVESGASLMVTGSAFGQRVARSGYRYRGPFLNEGTPRNDILVRNDPADEARVRARLGVPPETGILLYAPTFRDADVQAGRQQRVELDLPHVLEVVESATGRPWVCLYRAHYLSLGLTLRARDRLIDATDYPEMAELLRVADALITDYSCCAGDYALRGKPIWLYQADIDAYRADSRQLYFDMADSPYWTADSPEALDALIRRTTPESAAENCRAILDFYDTHETGNAARAVAAYICARLSSDRV